MPKAWNNWYHVTLHTYGSWLRGDPRGWRSRNHRVHVEGDYKHRPAPGTYEREYRNSLAIMKRPQVRIAATARQLVLSAVIEKLQRDRIEVLIGCLDGIHLHLLGRFNDHDPKQWLGRAKKHSSHILREQGIRTDAGGIWAKYSYAVPIVDRSHELSTFRYIERHSDRGAALWSFKQSSLPPAVQVL